jgi:hypothetical protein
MGTTAPGSTRCAVPVMLCDKCFDDPSVDNSKQRCDLCQEGYVDALARVKIDLQAQKRKVLGLGGQVLDKSHAAAATTTMTGAGATTNASKRARREGEERLHGGGDGDGNSAAGAKKRPLLFLGGDTDDDGGGGGDQDDESANIGGGGGAAASESQTNQGLSTASSSKPVSAVLASSSSSQLLPKDGRRLFVKQLPFVVTAAEVREALGTAAGGDASSVELIDWKRDASSGLFYGAALVLMASAEAAARTMAASNVEPGIAVGDVAAAAIAAAAVAAAAGNKAGSLSKKPPTRKDKSKRLKVTLAPLRNGEVWPPPGFNEESAPPVV